LKIGVFHHSTVTRTDCQPVEPFEWTVREFVLIHSLLGRTEYRVLGRWPLAAGA